MKNSRIVPIDDQFWCLLCQRLLFQWGLKGWLGLTSATGGGAFLISLSNFQRELKKSLVHVVHLINQVGRGVPSWWNYGVESVFILLSSLSRQILYLHCWHRVSSSESTPWICISIELNFSDDLGDQTTWKSDRRIPTFLSYGGWNENPVFKVL